MRVAIFGGTGFVGSYLVEALLARGHQPVLLTRPGSEQKVADSEVCELVAGTIEDQAAVRQTLRGADAAIYNIGILKEEPRRGITFDALHFKGARLATDEAAAAGVRRFLLMSANGVRADGTDYQKTKYMAEQYLQASGLDWTIFRPSVIFGDPRGRMEFATQLYRDILSMPMPAPLFYDGVVPTGAGSQQMSPVHAQDVARVFAESLGDSESVGKIIPLGGPQSLSWKQMLEIIGEATGRRVFGIPTPAWTVKIVAGLLASTDILPVTRDQITMLMEGNTCDSSAVFARLGIDPIPFDAEHLQYLSGPKA